MKNYHFTFALLLNITLAYSQVEKKPDRFMFKMAPMHLFRNTLKVGGEFLNGTKTSSIVVYGQVTSNNADKDPGWVFPYTGGGLELNYRKYIVPLQAQINRKGRSFTQGIYFSVFLQAGAYQGDYDYIEVEYDFNTQVRTETRVVYQEKSKNAATGFAIGLQRVFWETISVDLNLGAGYQIGGKAITGTLYPDSYRNLNSPFDDAGFTGVLPKGGILLGIFLK